MESVAKPSEPGGETKYELEKPGTELVWWENTKSQQCKKCVVDVRKIVSSVKHQWVIQIISY